MISSPYLYDESTERLLSTPSHYAYLKITEGCNHRCSFCVNIPSIRGKQRSRQIDSIQKEALQLIDRVKEIILIGQEYW